MAKRFRFRLDAVERVRRQRRDEQRRAVAEAIRAVQQVDEHMARLNEQIRRSMEEAVAGQRGGPLDLAMVRSHEFHRGWLHRQLAGARIARDERSRELARRRRALAEATKQLRVIEKLREKQWQGHIREIEREEQMLADEMTLARYCRTVSGVSGDEG
jgi:flagellar FliJ protein